MVAKKRQRRAYAPKLRKIERKVSRDIKEIEKNTLRGGREVYKHGRMLGPGLIAGAADDDDGGIATYSVVGATTGYALAWLMLLTTPMLIVVQGICARLGNVTHKGLATLITQEFGKKVAIAAALILVIANVSTIAADIAGMSVAGELLTGFPWYYFVIPLCLIIVYVLVYKNFNSIQKVLIYLSLVLLAYVVAGFLASPDWGKVVYSTFVPQITFSLPFLIAAVGLLGTTITPYLFFWQTTTEIEAKRTEKQSGRVNFDIFTGMIYSNIISYFIIISTGTLLYGHSKEVGTLATAADPVRFIALALRPVAGDYSYYLFAVGLLAAGLLAVGVLATSTAYVIAETLGWNRGLNKQFNQARKFYGALGGAVVGGVVILSAGVKPFDALYYSQVLAGILDPILLVMVVKLASDEKLMGQHAIRGWWKRIAWLTVAVITLFVLLLFYSIFFPSP